MARGSNIIVTSDPEGLFDEGVIATAQTPKPGTIMQKDPTVALSGGRHTFKIYDRAADGDRPAGALWVLLADNLQGKGPTDAYAAGDRARFYCPKPGDELNLLMADVSGTGDDHTKGELMMVDDGTGKLIATTGSPQSAPFQLLETVTDPVADQLVWVSYGGV